MRSELIDLYKLACANPQDKDIVRAYQSARDRIGPQIAIHEAIDNDALRNRVARLEEALPDSDKLEILAKWFDMQYPSDTNPEVQTDLREWAKKIRNALEEK